MSSSYDRSLQSLWKIITGNSAITNPELILEEIDSVKDVLKEGLDFFKPRSSKSESALKSSKSVKGRKLDFIIETSKHLVLDELQCLGLFQNFLMESYRGSFSEINKKLANESEKKLLLTQVKEYYYKERLYLLRCLKQFFGYWQDGSHPYRKVYEKTLVKIEFDGSFIPRVWKQFDRLSSLEVPIQIESADEESKWLRQNVLEQIEMLELLLLFYKDYEMSIDIIIEKFNMFQRICFCLAPRGRYTPGMSNDPLCQHLSSLCVLVLLEGLDLEYLLQIHDNVNGTSANDHHLSKPNIYQRIMEFESILKDTNHISCHTPLLLAWFNLRYMLCGDDGDTDNAQSLGNTALQNKVFEVILKMLRSPFFTGDRPVAGVCQSIYYTIVSLGVSLFSESSLGDTKLLYEISSCVLNHPRMRLTFWEKGLDKGLGLLLKGAMTRFPHNGLVDLLIPLSRDEYSANNIHTFMSNLTNYTEQLTPHTLAKVIDIGPEEGTWITRVSRPILESEYRSLGLPPLVLEKGTVGVVIEDGTSSNGTEVQVVSWRVVYSGWDLFAALVQRLLSTPGIGVDTEPHPLIDFTSMMYKLITEIIQYDWSIIRDIRPLILQIYTILQKFSLLPHPPIILISCCIDCLSVLVKKEEPYHVWEDLKRTRFLPQLLTPPGDPNSLQTSPGYYGLLLNNWERAHGTYPVTMATLRLLLNTLLSHDYHMIPEDMVASTVYIMQAVFVSSHNWRYKNQTHRDRFCHQLLTLCCSILQKGRDQSNDDNNLQSVLHTFVVNHLLHSSGHLLLVNTLGTGVNAIDRMTSLAISSCQPAITVESVKLCFTITDLLLKNKIDESITPLEQALATRTVHHSSVSMFSSFTPSQHLIAELFSYIYHHDDPAVPLGATKLLGRLAAVAPMSMFSFIGQDALALRDCFNTRLSAVSEDPELRKAILQLIYCSIGSQPGLLELFLSLKRKSDKKTTTITNKDPPGVGTESTSLVYMINEESCLWPVLDMIDPEKQNPPVPPSLLSSGVRLLRNLWHARHTAALEAVRSSRDNFWKHITKLMTEKIDIDNTKQKVLTHKLQTAAHLMYIIAMELYYVMQIHIDKSLKTGIEDFLKKDGYAVWCKCLRNISSKSDSADVMDYDRVGVVSVEVLKTQEQLAESWRALLIVAANQHEALFELHVQRRKTCLLRELIQAMESQVELLPQSVNLMSHIFNLYMTLVKKWESSIIDSNLIGTLSNILEKITKCESRPETWELLTLIYATIMLVVSSMRKNEGDIEPRFVCGIIPSIQIALETHTYYDKLNIKHRPEVYAISLLTEVTMTSSNDHSMWLDSLKEHCIVMILMRISTGYLDVLCRPDLIDAILGFFLNLAKLKEGAELLKVNNISQLLTIPLGNVVSKLNTMSPGSNGNSLAKANIPPPEWMRVWFTAVTLETRLLNVLGHYFIESSLDFVGAHSERLQQCLDIYVATRHLQATMETKIVCQFLQQLVFYQKQWMFSLLSQHNSTIDKIIHLFNGSVAVLSRGRMKDIIKAMDSQGILNPEHGSASLKAKSRQRRTSGGSQVVISSEDDSWVKSSPAYLQLQERLIAIITSCVTILNLYSPPLSDMFMCTLTRPVDLAQWPPLFIINSVLPVVDPTAPPSITTLTTTLTIGCDVLRKLEPQSGHRTPSRSPSKTSPIRSPVTPFVSRLNSEVVQQKRIEILYMLEQAVSLLISQSLRYLLDNGVHHHEKQTLKKQLVSELSNFSQSLLLNFSRKGAPSPHSLSHRTTTTPLSSSSTLFQDNLSGRTSSHCFSDTPEQGIFKLADMFAKNLTR